jgi:hypothetical protein
MERFLRFRASAGSDAVVRFWDPISGMEIAQVRGHIGSIRSVAFAPDSLTFATSGADRTIRIWDTPDPINLATYFPICDFKKEEARWDAPPVSSPTAKGFGFVNVPTSCYLSVLHGGRGEVEADRLLFARFLRAGNLDGARHVLDRLGGKGPALRTALAEGLRQAGTLALGLGVFPLAEYRLHQARSLEPNASETDYLLASCYSKRANSQAETPEGRAARDKDIEQAIDCLERAATKGWTQWDRLKRDRILDPLRQHPRYQKLVGRP